MRHKDFPALYLAADEAAIETQSTLLCLHKCNNVLLITGAVVASTCGESKIGAMAAAAIFFGSLGFYVYGQVNNLQSKWYKTRALAESIKTSTWRFVMHAEPFNIPLADCRLEFQRLLKQLLDGNTGIAVELAGQLAEHDSVTAGMISLQESSFTEKKETYRVARINEQHAWYAKKAEFNKRSSRKWFCLLVCLYVLAIGFLLMRVAYPLAGYLPVDAIAVAAGCTIGWMQLKRFSELASAYGLTAHEISIIKIKFESLLDADALASFVKDAESAFSREHTQWAARQDHLV